MMNVNRTPTVYLARMRGGLNLLCECLRILEWRQGGMRDMSQCDFYFVGPQVATKLKEDDDFRNLRKDQSCNRLPGMHWITLKGPTTRAIQLFNRLARETSASFYPTTFVLPEDSRQLTNHLATASVDRIYILKPSKGSQGKGIILATRDQVQSKAIEMSQDGPCIVQHYLSTPHTLNGLKYDLRLYVVITSVSPLECWLYNEGLARFCTEPYATPNADNLDVSYMHLSNYSLNCDSPTYDFNKTKQKLTDVVDVLCSDGGGGGGGDNLNRKTKTVTKGPKLYDSTTTFWDNMIKLCRKTICALHPHLMVEHDTIFRATSSENRGCRCFQIIGLDAMLDIDGNMTLLEVNCNPSLNVMKAKSQVEKSDVDVDVKVGLLCGTLRLVNGMRNGKKSADMLKEMNGEWKMTQDDVNVNVNVNGRIEQDEDDEETVEQNIQDVVGVVETVETVKTSRRKEQADVDPQDVQRRIQKKMQIKKKRQRLKERKRRKAEIWATCPLPFFPIVIHNDAAGGQNEREEGKEEKSQSKEEKYNTNTRCDARRSSKQENGEEELELGTECFLRHRSHFRRGDRGTLCVSREVLQKALRVCGHSSKEQLATAQSMLRSKYGQQLSLHKFFDAVMDISEIMDVTFVKVLKYLPK